MGLKLAIAEQDNVLYADFTDAYWKVDGIMFTNMDGESYVTFSLDAYPSREAKYKNLNQMPTSTLPIGSASPAVYDTVLYSWETYAMITDIFPSGIPLDENEQKTAIYNWVKAYTKLSFTDVLED